MLARDEQTIIAQCTPHGSGAIALLRLSGSEVRQIVNKISKLPGNKDIKNLSTSSAHFGWIIDDYCNIIDQVMFIILDGPKTFTGENVIEITCHNNPFIIQEIINLAIKNGARLAYEGEFTKRAFLNNKIDLLQAEAINELVHANTQFALKKSLSQLEGTFSNQILFIEKQLLKMLAWCDASFEFLDEEKEFGKKIKEQLLNIIDEIKKIKSAYDVQIQIRNGIRIALLGSVNAGKSLLFNTLLNQKRSIVTEIAGTTRDVIEAGLYKNGNYWTLIDTAGFRQANDKIEKEGIKRSFNEAKKADIIILVFDGSRFLTSEELDIYRKIIDIYENKIIFVESKSDLDTINKQSFSKNFIEISAKNKINIDILEKKIEQKIMALFSKIESPFLLNKRQYSLLLKMEEKLDNILPMLNFPINYEIVSYHIKDAIEDLSELTGKSVSEIGLDMIFKEFCIGK